MTLKVIKDALEPRDVGWWRGPLPTWPQTIPVGLRPKLELQSCATNAKVCMLFVFGVRVVVNIWYTTLFDDHSFWKYNPLIPMIKIVQLFEELLWAIKPFLFTLPRSSLKRVISDASLDGSDYLEDLITELTPRTPRTPKTPRGLTVRAPSFLSTNGLYHGRI